MLALRASQLIDGQSAVPIQDAVVLIDGERIQYAGPMAAAVIPDDLEITDLGQATIIPGLIDAHVHVHASGKAADSRNYAVQMVTQTQGTLALRSYQHVRKSLAMGFTTLRSVASPAYVDVALRNAINEGVVVGPRMRAAGQGLTITGGHMDGPMFSPDVQIAGRTGVCDGPWECRKATREQIKRGADVIKINAAVSRYRLDYSKTTPFHREMTYEEMAAICEEAHWWGLRVAAHAHGGEGITDAIRAGLDSVEHAPWLTNEQIDLMVEHEVYYVPTLTVHTYLLALGQAEIGMSDAAWNWLLRVCDDRWDTLARAKQAGVKIATGTDIGFFVPHGDNAFELEDLVRGGFTPMEAIQSATSVAAACLDMDDDVGALAPGKFADIVVVAGDPLADIRILQDPAKILNVYKGGSPID